MPEQERSIVYHDDLTLTQHEPDSEYEIARDDVLIMTIAPDARLTYCNEAFIRASGYTHEELIGEPQVLFNRRDMPAEVLRDLWATLEAGSFWSSVVLTRRKSGARYWVHATIAPASDVDCPMGYIIVCTRPRRALVRSTAEAYQTMRRTAQRWSRAVCSAVLGEVILFDTTIREIDHAGP
jgi:aerotaxis receptor